MPTLIQIIIASVIISSLSLGGAFILVLGQSRLHRLNLVLVALAAGTMMGGAFFHLIPEGVEELAPRLVGLIVVLGFLIFFVLEKLFHWHHCHHQEVDDHFYQALHQKTKRRKSLGYLNLSVDLLHNFIDGLVIAAAFMVSTEVGVATTLAVAMHEIPQELGDFGVLLHAGFAPAKALLLNFLSAWTALLGALLGYFFLKDTNLVIYLLPLTAGGFLYIAASDLIPEIKHQATLKASLSLLLVFVLGLGVMWFLV